MAEGGEKGRKEKKNRYYVRLVIPNVSLYWFNIRRQRISIFSGTSTRSIPPGEKCQRKFNEIEFILSSK